MNRTITRAEDEAVFLNTACGIGEIIAEEALWHEDRCTWVGVMPDGAARRRQMGLAYSTLGPDLYGGTSGVGLFLGELYAATGDASVGRAATGAIRHALARTDVIPRTERLGLFTGWIGVALAAVRLGKIIREGELVERAYQLLRRCTWEEVDGTGFDLIAGRAGGIAGLVALAKILDDPSLLEPAAQLGDDLLRTADRSRVGWSWSGPPKFQYRNLTGFSHGAAGVAYALMELFQATGEAKYRTGAEQAFAYERHWFDEQAANWPDFRRDTAAGRRVSRKPSFSTVWCHGAPGIALSRLRAFEITQDEIYRSEAVTGLETTRHAVEVAQGAKRGNYSLCHGLAGNTEVLMHGYQVLGQEWEDAAALAREVAMDGIEMYEKREHGWPYGTNGGETPALMLGLAGIGLFYLRLSRPAVPSILSLRSNEYDG